MKPLREVDWFILERGFMPVAHWVDYRFHRNCYDLCTWALTAGIALNWGAVGNIAAHGCWGGFAMCALASIGLTAVYGKYLTTAKKASHAYERGNPMPREALLFWGWAPRARLFIGFTGTAILALAIAAAIAIRKADSYLDILLQSWLLFMACGIYFGGCLPSGRARHKKKERRWLTTLFPRLAANPT